MPRSRSRTTALAGVVLASTLSILCTGSAVAADSLATPISGTLVRELWPLEVTVEVARIDPESTADRAAPLPSRTVVVPDGHRLVFSSTVPTQQGKQRFELVVVPRQHPGAVEFEWDLEVFESRFRPIGWTDYLKHRFRLADPLRLGEERLKIARSDIVSSEDDSVYVRFEVDGETFEIRMLAVTTRG